MKSILLVDDNVFFLLALERQLKSYPDDWEISTATNGRAALRMASARSFDLVVTDILMPDQDGLETIRVLRRQCPATKLVAMTGGGDHVGPNFLKIAETLGAHESLTKPFPPEALVHLLRRLLDTAPHGCASSSGENAPLEQLSRAQLPVGDA